MFYTDAPASSFWANYIKPGSQDDVATWTSNDSRQTAPTAEDKAQFNPRDIQDRLKRKIVQYINENNIPDITEDDIVWFGIRDWGQEPYGGANHAWRPERRYWNVLARLGDIETAGGAHIHVCGEAYSDYHGFIEGALRSSIYTLNRIFEGENDVEQRYRFQWLAELLGRPESGSNDRDATRFSAYCDALRTWARFLDCSRVDPYLYAGESHESIWSRDYYFAYGSNLAYEQMKKRCPESEPLSVGKLRDYRLTTNERGHANIVESLGDEIIGRIFMISSRDRTQLDEFEHVNDKFYTCRKLLVELPDSSEITRLVYISENSEAKPLDREYRKRVLPAWRANTPAWYFAKYVQPLLDLV
jgi:hypothetical protein